MMILRKIIDGIVSLIQGKEIYFVSSAVVLVLLAGWIYSHALGNDLRYRDESEYVALARNLLTRHLYSLDGEQPTALRPPGYPLFLSGFVLLGADVVHLRLVNFLMFCICIYLLFLLIKSNGTSFAGVIGGGLVLCYPVLFYAAGTLFPQIFASALFLATLYLLSRRDSSSIKHFVIAGLVFGYLILTIPIFVFTFFVVCLWIVFSSHRARLKAAFTFLACGLLVVAIWSIRNVFVFGSFVFISTNSGFNLLIGNSENTTANAGLNIDLSRYHSEAAKLSEVERDSYYRSKAVDFVLENKSRAAKLYLQKVLNYFNYQNRLMTDTESSPTRDLMMILTYYPLLLLFLFRLFSMKWMKTSPFEVLLIFVYLSSALFQAIFFTRIRFRLPFDFVLIAVVAMYLANVLDRERRARAKLSYFGSQDPILKEH